MGFKVLIVEDEILVALNLRQTLRDKGYDVVGIAPDAAAASRLAETCPEIALVDLNLRDGATGPGIGERLANETGASVLFVTANPRQVADGVPGVFGVLSKPYDEASIGSAVDFLADRRSGGSQVAPRDIRVFH